MIERERAKASGRKSEIENIHIELGKKEKKLGTV